MCNGNRENSENRMILSCSSHHPLIHVKKWKQNKWKLKFTTVATLKFVFVFVFDMICIWLYLCICILSWACSENTVLTTWAKYSVVAIHNSCYFGAHTYTMSSSIFGGGNVFLEMIKVFLEKIIVFLEMMMLDKNPFNFICLKICPVSFCSILQ